MNYKMEYKKVLIVGLGKSGVSAAKFLHSKGVDIVLNDIKPQEELEEVVNELSFATFKLGVVPEGCFDGIDLIVVSPGVDFESPWIKIAQQKNIKVVSETELAYWFIPCPIVGITGTNGKTTTTTLVGEIFKNSKTTTHIVGNIGTAITSKVNEMTKDDVVVCELSSFQILNCEKFAPKVYSFLNLTPDHLDKHGTVENYANAKAKMLDAMDENSFAVLNKNDSTVCSYANKVKGTLLWFDCENEVESGAYCKDGKIYVNMLGKQFYLMDRSQIKIKGKHNLGNALAAICMTFAMGIDQECIKKTLMEFMGVEHRLEYVCTINGVEYINDSKGTNVDAAIVAIRAMDKPTVLIAGGYDKGADFDQLILELKDTVKYIVATGQTANKILETAYKHNFKNIHIESDFECCVKSASEIAKEGYTVLLSPACASWGVFKNFEQRGNQFKTIVKGLG